VQLPPVKLGEPDPQVPEVHDAVVGQPVTVHVKFVVPLYATVVGFATRLQVGADGVWTLITYDWDAVLKPEQSDVQLSVTEARTVL
jgi:hypothetical protein